MVDILDPQPDETIYDPACGTGGMLLGAIQHVREKNGDIKRLFGRLFGQEKNLTTASIAKMNLFLHGIDDFHILRDDTLRRPRFIEDDRLKTFDCVIANPPFHWKNGEKRSGSLIPTGVVLRAYPPPAVVITPGFSIC